MIQKVVLGVAMIVLMLTSSTVTFVFLGSRTSHIADVPEKPTEATPRAQALRLPGTLYMAQAGAIYSLTAGRFRQLTPESGWSQPSLYPDQSRLLVVRRLHNYSDIYIMSRFGVVQKRLTSNLAPPRSYDTGANHWAFYPRLGRDGRIYLSYDEPKGGYAVVLSIWSMSPSGNIKQGKLWTNADDYTGGDVQPIPVRTGIIYTKYSYGPNDKLTGQLYYLSTPWARARGAASGWGTALTSAGEDCRSPQVSPSGKQIAMICTYQKQISYLTVASWNGSSLGPRKNIVTGQLVAQPTWAPDGSGIAYLAPGVGGGPFQLWWLPRAAYAPPPTPVPTPTPGGPHNGPIPTPSPTPVVVVKPVEVTTNNGFDATSPLAWAS
jgi:hypothetical protein